ncbi:MAG: VPLPA-CTERM sorting domain-containing protein [Gammaproteobacteria bacterium]
MRVIIIKLSVILICLSSSTVNASFIDFESISGITGMTNIPGSAVPLASQLSNQLQSSTGATFSSDSLYVAVVNLGTGTTSPSLGIGGVNTAGQLNYGVPIVVTFTDPNDALIPATTDYVSIRGDTVPASGSATLEAFDVNGALLGSTSANDIAGGLTLTLSIAGIHSIRLSETVADIAFDDLTFNDVAPIPLPAAIWLFGSGLLGLIGIARRRKAA